MKTPNFPRILLSFTVIFVAVLLALAAVFSIAYRINGGAFSENSVAALDFPAISSDLSETRQAILAAAKQEYEDPKSPETYITGAWEPWCADFVSYIYKEAGYPFKNPNSGSWRIPGIYTLKDYFISVGRWQIPDHYIPEPGDVAIYDGGIFGGHTNLVLSVDGDELTTLGGNEGNKVNLMRFNFRDQKYGLQGFGLAP